jgi:hypothetical protein
LEQCCHAGTAMESRLNSCDFRLCLAATRVRMSSATFDG